MPDTVPSTLAGQLWSDEPATVDLLAARAVAETVADAVLDDALDPLSIGLSGPWGSGKTTVLDLVRDDLVQRSTPTNKVLVVRTDPWRYDPAVGAKESIIAEVLEAIAVELEALPKSQIGEAVKLVQRLARRVDWAKAFKMAATASLALQIPSVDQVIDLVKAPDDAADDAGEPRGLAGFRAEFETLMTAPELEHVRRVAVLVDDLDRCLADTVVESLEAIRLFLSVPRMAFVIAADEDRVAEAIRAKLPEWEMPAERPGGEDALPPEPPWKLYLHKIVQTTVPLPALGAYDTEAYLMLLLVGNRAADALTSGQMTELIDECGRLRQVGALDELQAPSGTDVQAELSFAHRLTTILYEKLAGNPRRIKRFLNDLNIRRSIATRRGIELDAEVVAKLMVLEVLLPRQFKEVLAWLRTGELRDRLGALEALANNLSTSSAAASTNPDIPPAEGTEEAVPADTDDVRQPPTKSGAKQRAKAAPSSSKSKASAPPETTPLSAETSEVALIDQTFDDDLIRWAKLIPLLSEIDLSPYLHLAASFSGDLLVSQELPLRLRDVAAQLTLTGALRSRDLSTAQIARLPLEDARTLMRHLALRARDRAQEQRGAVTGIGRLAAAHPQLVPLAFDSFRRIPAADLQPPSAIHIGGLKLAGIDELVIELAARTTGQTKAALDASINARRP